MIGTMSGFISGAQRSWLGLYRQGVFTELLSGPLTLQLPSCSFELALLSWALAPSPALPSPKHGFT